MSGYSYEEGFMGHHHDHGHDHNYNHGHAKGKRLLLTIVLNIIITLAQVIGGLISGSLSLLSDAAHNFSDVIALVISWIAEKLSQKKYSSRQTYGYKRAEVLAAVINVVTIIVIAINIFIEGMDRLLNPESIGGMMVIALAGLSILLNGLSVLLIKGDAENSMNLKSAYLHLFSDMLTSIAVLLGGIMIYFFEIYWVDGVIAIGIALYLIKTSIGLLMEALKVLMQFTPEHLVLDQVKARLESLTYVDNIHHVHAWQLVDNDIHFEAHVSFKENLNLEEVNGFLDQIKTLLHDEFHIEHSTLEAEYGKCQNHDMIREC